MPPTTHARLGASSSKRWMECPGSVALSEGLPDTSSSYATEGTAAHEVVEWVLAGDYAAATDVVGQFVRVVTEVIEGDEISELVEVTEEMASACQVMIDHVHSRYLELSEGAVRLVEIYLERTFDLGSLGPPEPMFGTADVTLWVPSIKHLEVIDYKNGTGVVVEVEENPQLMMYGLGATVAQGTIPNSIRVTIVQPNADHYHGPVRSYDFDRERLIEFKGELFAAAQRTQESNAPLAVGDWCRFCRAKSRCPAQLEHATSVATIDFDIEPEDDLVALLPTPALLTHDDVARIVDRASIMMDWLRDVESYALTVMEQGGTIPGYKLIAKKTNRKWEDDDATLRFLAREGLKINERTKRKVISPAQAEKKLPKARLKLLEKYWTKPEGQPKLARTDDPRPELPLSVDADFGHLIEPLPGADTPNDEQDES